MQRQPALTLFQISKNQAHGSICMAMRRARFSGPSYDTLAEGTVRSTISFVAQTFRNQGVSNLTKDKDGELGRLLQRQFRAYRNADPKPKQQKALPLVVIKEMAKNQTTESARAISQFGIGAFFYAMRSCEYLKVQQAEKRRTYILRLRNFFAFSLFYWWNRNESRPSFDRVLSLYHLFHLSSAIQKL